MTNMFDLTGKVALVIGIGGLGQPQAVGLADAGATVALADIDMKRLEAVSAEIADKAHSVKTFQVNVTDAQSVEALVADVVKEYGRIDILLNSAGMTRRFRSEEFDEDVFDQIIALNLNGLFYACQEVGKVMIRQGGGRIINMGSIFSAAGLPESLAYSTSKGAVAQITRTLAVEWAEHGIAVNGIMPSWFETPMGNVVANYKGASTQLTPEQLHERTVGRVPLRRKGMPDEIIGATVFLASDAASMVTGHMLAVDGGFLAQ